ncbi:ABC transporter substrate-binding protein [Lapillicoccus sp.]|uniref:ABC transporter substrate-binding protein n=1 Tax=Lapillicoccus sp. TaxID=1909287 RepID=UPI0025EBB773|nr:ABC transporter substrate-binding protein [Lapillicoccus sp.]
MVSIRSTPALSVAAGLLALGGLAACSAPETAAPGAAGTGTGGSPAACTKAALKLQTAGRFTVGTDKPAYPPWFVDNTPTNGKGYESAVAYAVAAKLGFATTEVTWVTVPFNNAVTPGVKSFDVDINQVSISDARKQAVDFSSGYYGVRQAVVTTKGSVLDGKTSVAALASAKLGAQVGTTSYTAITDQIKPSQQAAPYDTNDLAVQALKNGQIDGIVVDLPTAFFMTSAQLDNGVIVGQLPQAGSTPEQFGMVLDKGSALTACVSRAVDALRTDGTLDRLAAQYLTAAGAPELK